MKMIKEIYMFCFLAVCILLFPSSIYAGTITVKTKSPENNPAIFQYRVPKNYDATRKETYRVLVFFGGRDTDGKSSVSGYMGWGEWCDALGIFIVAPGLKGDRYWEPEIWSGKALQDALLQLKEKYNICTSKLLFYGHSAGSQASNLFPAWKPELCRAWVSHACGVFHEPTLRMKNVPGLVTCGDADHARYIISRNFVEKCHQKGILIIWKSFPNTPHKVPLDSANLARAFLEYYHELYRSDLLGRSMAIKKQFIEYVGDDQDGVYYPVDSPKAKNILPENRVELPNKSIADAWGSPAK